MKKFSAERWGPCWKDTQGRRQKGEVVVCIGKGRIESDPEVVRAALVDAMKDQKLKDAAAEVADQFGVSKRDLYQMGLALKHGH